MLKANVYTSKGVKSKSISLPKDWQEKANGVLLAQAIRVYEWAKHSGTSKVKTRGEVSYSTRKIYRQKGTGGARHGGRGAPIFVKGGVAHGPKGVKRKLTLSTKMRKKALLVALSGKIKEGSVVVVTGISGLKKTKDAATFIKKVVGKEKDVEKGNRFTFALSEKNSGAFLALRNIENVIVLPYRNLNAYDVFYAGVLVIDKEALSETKEKKDVRVKKDAEKKITKEKSSDTGKVKKTKK